MKKKLFELGAVKTRRFRDDIVYGRPPTCQIAERFNPAHLAALFCPFLGLGFCEKIPVIQKILRQNWCFFQFYHSRIEVLQNYSAVFVSVTFVREILRELRDFFFHKNPALVLKKWNLNFLIFLCNSLIKST